MFFSALPLYMWIAVIIVLLFLIAANRWNMTWVSVADKKYHVRKVSNVDPKESAEMLHKLTKNMTRFVEEASDKYPMDARLQNLKNGGMEPCRKLGPATILRIPSTKRAFIYASGTRTVNWK